MKRLSGLLVLFTLSTILSSTPAQLGSATGKPNIVIIMSDDQRWDTMTPRYMPNLFSKLVPNGVTYDNSFVPNPLCCPSRSSTLTGNYSQTTGVWSNEGGLGGFEGFNSHNNEGRTMAIDFHESGYRTGLVGKYLNGYPSNKYSYIPLGWDRWFSVDTGTYYNYYAADNGQKSAYYGNSPADYAGRVLTSKAIDFINSSGSKPFFLYFALTAPHGPATPDPRDVNRFGVEWPNGKPPSFGEDVSDKPAYVRQDAVRWNKRIINNFHKKQLNATYGVDRALGQVWDALPDNTYVLFVSDNGFLWGEHDRQRKQVPYNESLRVPAVLAYKGSPSPLPVGTDQRILLNVDYLPTLERLAGVPRAPGHTVEGVDFLAGPPRADFPIGHEWVPGGSVPTYCGVRNTGWMYAQYVTGEEELYDESADPFELDNRAYNPAYAAKLATMQSRAGVLCTGGRWYPDPWPFP